MSPIILDRLILGSCNVSGVATLTGKRCAFNKGSHLGLQG
jgi:hypothetical protein